jgi:N-acetylmuramoyl-L-alanine amidase
MIILDNGHGNNTAGKRSPLWADGAQLLEWEFNRDIVKRIKRSLDKICIPNIILVPEARDISLSQRVERANMISSEHKNSFLLSIHGNASDIINQGTGWEVWTSPGETEADKIATRLFLSAKQNLPGFSMRSDYSDKDPDKESRFYILVNTRCPAVLTENLFYTNEDDCRFMLSEDGRYLIAHLHVEAITKYLII